MNMQTDSPGISWDAEVERITLDKFEASAPMEMQKDTGNVERYTPVYILDAARACMGGITLDVASCDAAQTHVKATHYYALPVDGRDRPWFGNVWVNWPYSRADNPSWADKVIREVYNLDVHHMCCITWLSGASDWFQRLHSNSDAYCILNKRPRFIDGETMKPMPSAMKDGIVWYFGPDMQQFYSAFNHLGGIGRPI